MSVAQTDSQSATHHKQGQHPNSRRGQFKKGNQLGYRGGRKKKHPDVTAAALVYSKDCVERLAAIVLDEDERTTDQISAASILLAYAHGKPVASVESTVQYDVTLDFLAALREINGKVDTGAPKLINGAPPQASQTPEDAEIIDAD